jgi:hypothetical protein
MTSDGASIHTAVGRSRQRDLVDRCAATEVTIRDQVGTRRGTASSLRPMEPEPEVARDGDRDPDLDAIARDLAAVEDALARLVDSTYENGEHPAPGSATP